MKFFDTSKKLALKLSKMRNKKLNIERKVPTDVDDDELADKISRFNSWLAEIAKKYRLNHNDIETMIQMFESGATLEQMAIYASEQQLIRQEAYEQSCQRIADTINGGRGLYHGYIGKNNPQKEIDDYER